MVAQILSIAHWKPISYRGNAGYFTSPPIGLILHVQVGNNSPYLWMNELTSNRKFPHFWLSKGGYLEQYTTTNMKAWAAVAGNIQYWHVETEGFPNEPLTANQITGMTNLVNALHITKKVINSPGLAGLGTHSMGGIAWGNHNCPGAIRANQRARILNQSGPTIPSFPGYMKYGDHNDNVILAQRQFLRRGWNIIVDGYFGSQTLSIVKAFQQEKGLSIDGIIGPKTWDAMFRLPIT